MQSYSRGPEMALSEATIGDALRQIAARFPRSTAIVSRHQGARLSWAELDAQADAVARGLVALGLAPGDRVGLWSANSVEWLLVHMGCARAGVILVNVNPAYRSHELAFVLRKSRMKALFMWRADARANYAAILEEARVGDLALEHVIVFGEWSWKDLPRESGDLPDAIGPDEVANIQYTSGTTGTPKGVMLTHRNVVNNGRVLARGMRYTEQDCICVPVPLYHCFGCVIGTMSALASGAAILLPNWTFDPGATLEAVAAERATSLYGVPAMFIAELGHPDFARFDLTSLRTGMMAGAPCPIEVMRQVAEKMHCAELTIGYGQTESSPVVTMSALDDDMEKRVSTVGQALPATEVKIVTVVDGATVERGAPGEVCARGYMVMKGYDDEREATARAIDVDGWLHTGDLGVMRDDGYIHLTGRAKDLIIRGGENVYPREVEEFLYTHPKIAEVQVVGLPDERLGECVLAWIRLRQGETATEQDIRDFCAGRIAYFKIPQHIRFVTEFPMTVTGKVQKFRIRELEVQERGLESLEKRATA